MQNIFSFLARVIVLLVALPFHEAAHAWASYKLGDPTAKYQGRLTLNPFKHLDLFGSVSLLCFGIGWAKPVPVDPRYYKNRKVGMALSALAGPVSNILMAFASMILLRVVSALYVAYGAGIWYYLYLLFYFMPVINISLGIFNLLPVPPFDGSRILLLFLPEKAYFGLMKYERYIMIGIMLLLFLGVLDRPLLFLNNGLFSVFEKATNWVAKLVLSLVSPAGMAV